MRSFRPVRRRTGTAGHLTDELARVGQRPVTHGGQEDAPIGCGRAYGVPGTAGDVSIQCGVEEARVAEEPEHGPATRLRGEVGGRTAAAEVGHHLRRETVARNVTTMTRTYRAYASTLLGDYLDIRGQQATRSDDYASNRYDTSQTFGEEVRASGGAGVLYHSLRRRTGSNVVTHLPRNITDIVQTDHFEITVLATSRMIDVRKLSL
jgi:RES domain